MWGLQIGGATDQGATDQVGCSSGHLKKEITHSWMAVLTWSDPQVFGPTHTEKCHKEQKIIKILIFFLITGSIFSDEHLKQNQ